MSEIMHAVRVKSPEYMNRYMRRMLTVLSGTACVLYLAKDIVFLVVQSNLVMNGMITTVFVVGVSICFRNHYRLKCDLKALSDLDKILFESRDAKALVDYNEPMFIMSDLYKSLENSTKENGEIPDIPTPVARSMVNIANNRFEERRIRISYFVSLLIYLGLLGTFIGLSITVGSISGLISNLAMGLSGEQDLTETLVILIKHLEEPLAGMGTAFGTSLTGLSCSVVLGALAMSVNKAATLFSNSFSNWIYEYAMTSFTAGIEKHKNNQSAGSVNGNGNGNGTTIVAAHSPESEKALINIEQHLQHMLTSQQTLVETQQKQLLALKSLYKDNHAQNETLKEHHKQQLTAMAELHRDAASQHKLLDSIRQVVSEHETNPIKDIQVTVQKATDQLAGSTEELQKQTRLLIEQNAREDARNNESTAQRHRMIQSQLASLKLMKKQLESSETLNQQTGKLPDALVGAANKRLKETEQVLSDQFKAGQDEMGNTIEKAQTVHRDLLLRLFKALHRLYRLCLSQKK